MKKLKPEPDKVMEIMNELDSGYLDQKRDQYPPFALTSWDDRNRYREYVRRVLLRLQDEGKL